MTPAYIVLAYSVVALTLLGYTWRLRRRLREVDADDRTEAVPHNPQSLIAR